MLATGPRKATDPIMIGNAVFSFIPSRKITIMQGAKNPIPSVISAPRNACATMATISLVPVSPNNSPPPGKMLQLPGQTERRSGQQSAPHPDLNLAAGPAGHHSRPQPCADYRCAHQ